MPAMADTQARLRRSSRSRRPSPRSNHSSARTHSKATRSARAAGGPERSTGQPTRRASAGRQVDPAVGPVLDHVAQDVGQLQRHPEIVGERYGTDRVGAPEDGEREPADRAGDPPAVPHQLVDGLVGGAGHVHLAAVDQLAEGLHGQAVTHGGRRPPRPVPGPRAAGRWGRSPCAARPGPTWRWAADSVLSPMSSIRRASAYTEQRAWRSGARSRRMP